MSESLCFHVDAIEKLTATHPERAIPILEQRAYKYAAQTGWVCAVVNKHLEVVAIEPVQAVLRSEPQKALIVLHDGA